MSQNEDVLREGYNAFNRGDIPAVLELYAEDIEWIEPGGGNAPAGTFHGRDSVANDVFASVPASFDEFSAEADEVVEESEGHVVARGRFKGRSKSGTELDAPFEGHADVRDGKVVRFENKVDAEAWTAAWS